MSNEAEDLLVYGVAAAKVDSRAEARFYLEWVLRTDASLDQQTQAWYWLSRITDNPDEKRTCLDNVLAAYPNHPEARRDLAILEGRLKPEEMVDLRQADAPVAPSPALSTEDAQRFVCPNCGGKMAYAPERHGLYCQFCGYLKPEKKKGARATPGTAAQSEAVP